MLPIHSDQTIALIAPARSGEKESLMRIMHRLQDRGYNFQLAPNLLSKEGAYLAGSDKIRARTLMDAFINPHVDAIWCLHGGYGSTRILEHLDYDLIAQNPKPFIGMSDITALHIALFQKANLITYHGPTLGVLYGGDEINAFTEKHLYTETLSLPAQAIFSPGCAEGPLVGGNLTLISALMGTPWQLQTEGKILLIEEVNEEPYRIDRMLQQLRQGGLFDNIAGVILASFHHCVPHNSKKHLSLDQVLRDFFAEVPYPVLFGLPIGHIPEQVTLPLGARYKIDTDKQKIELLNEVVCTEEDSNL